MRINPVIVNSFINFFKKLTVEQGIDPAILGFYKLDQDEVRKFLEENCPDLEPGECKQKILDMFPALNFIREADKEALKYAEMELAHYFGTSYISEAFKKFTKKYSYSEIMDMLQDIQGSELEIFRDYAIGKWGAQDIDIRRLLEMPVYSVKIEIIKSGSLQLFLTQSLKLLGLKPANKLEQFIAHGDCLRIAHKDKDILILIAIFDNIENIILPVTQSSNTPMVLLNSCNKRGALVL